jgi:hypothetical protein
VRPEPVPRAEGARRHGGAWPQACRNGTDTPAGLGAALALGVRDAGLGPLASAPRKTRCEAHSGETLTLPLNGVPHYLSPGRSNFGLNNAITLKTARQLEIAA